MQLIVLSTPHMCTSVKTTPYDWSCASSAAAGDRQHAMKQRQHRCNRRMHRLPGAGAMAHVVNLPTGAIDSSGMS